MNEQEVLDALDFVPGPLMFQRPDGKWVAFCMQHVWKLVSTVEHVCTMYLEAHMTDFEHD